MNRWNRLTLAVMFMIAAASMLLATFLFSSVTAYHLGLRFEYCYTEGTGGAVVLYGHQRYFGEKRLGTFATDELAFTAAKKLHCGLYTR